MSETMVMDLASFKKLYVAVAVGMVKTGIIPRRDLAIAIATFHMVLDCLKDDKARNGALVYFDKHKVCQLLYDDLEKAPEVIEEEFKAKDKSSENSESIEDLLKKLINLIEK